MSFFERPPVSLYLLRHGQSEANVNKQVYREKPDHAIRLTPLGLQQAEEAGQFLHQLFMQTPEEAPAILLHSPFDRARSTAEMVLKQASPYISEKVELPELAEQQFGLFDGVPPDELAATFPNEYKRYKLAQEFNGRFWACPPQGESLFDVYTRVSAVANMVRFAYKRNAITTFIIVAHANVLRCLMMAWCNQPYESIITHPVPGNSEIIKIKGQQVLGSIFKPSQATAEAPHGPPKQL